jgi:signal transduction histidine kinase
MNPHKTDDRSKGKKFKLVKYFAWASFIVLAIFSFPFSMIVSQQTKEILRKSYENYSRLIGKNLHYQITQNLIFPLMLSHRQLQLSNPEQNRLMDKIVINTIHGFNIESVNIFDIVKNKIAYSTDPQLYGRDVEESLEYKKALAGDVSSILIEQRSGLWFFNQLMETNVKLRTFVPLKGVYYQPNPERESFSFDPNYIFGVFEFTQDMTKEYKDITRFQYLIFGLSILIMALIFVVLLLVVRKAEVIIENRVLEQQKLEAQLNQAERLASLGEMVAGVSHEIKNPLGIIRSTAELLAETAGSNEPSKRLSVVIIEESTRLNNIVTEFLDFARPPILNLQDCKLEEILQKNLNFLQPELEKWGIKVQSNLQGRTFILQADQDLLYRAFLNIMINAIQSMMSKGGVLQVRVEKEKDYYELEVEDNGSGISAENMQKIFNPFFTTKEKGTGLGLSIVKKIIEGHKGTIELESLRGQGTKVKVYLPRYH